MKPQTLITLIIAAGITPDKFQITGDVVHWVNEADNTPENNSVVQGVIDANSSVNWNLQYAKDAKIAQLKALYDIDVAANVTVGVNAVSYVWKGDLVSASFVRDRILADEQSLLPAVDHWYDINHTKVTMVLADLKNIAAAIALKDHGARENLENCRAVVMAATTIEEVNAVTW